MKNRRQHLAAWITLLLVAIVIGCGGGSSVFRTDVAVRDIKLHPRVKVVPHDGSVVITAFGDDGIQFRGAPLNLAEDDYVVAITPVTDEARHAVNHLGGYLSPAVGLHLVPREHLPYHFHTPGNADYSHFVIHFGRVVERIVDSGPMAIEGSKAYFDAGTEYYPKFLGSIAHAVSSGVSSVSNAATSAASSVASTATAASSVATSAATSAGSAVTSGATSAASSVASTATNVASATSSAVTTSVSAAQSAVTDAASSIGAIDDAITTIRSVGKNMSTIIEAAEMEFTKAISNPMEIVNEIKDFIGFLLTGNLTASIDSNGHINMAFEDLEVKSEDGNASATLNGTLSFGYSEDGSLKIANYQPESLEFDFTGEFQTSLELTNVKGSKTLPIRTYSLAPIVVDAGIPVIITREIDVGISISAGVNTSTSLTVNGSFSTDLKASDSGLSTNGSGNVTGSAVAPSIAGTNGTVSAALVITPRFKLYDSGGPYLKFSIAKLSASDNPAASQITTTLTNELASGVDLTALGYEWSYEKDVFSEELYSQTSDY